jgi:hypothetical protein
MLPRSALLAVLVPLPLFLAFNPASAAPADRAADLALVNRLSWGETAQGDTMGGLSRQAWLQGQLHPDTRSGADDKAHPFPRGASLMRRSPGMTIVPID